ncbi:MAG: sodium-translocating pyrophosphatase [Candidatus Pacearchaeota archaeon]
MAVLPIILALVVALIGLAFAIYQAITTSRFASGSKEMKEISNAIQRGAITFLNKEYIVLAFFIVIVGAILSIFAYKLAIAFVVGAFFSALAGNIGMRVATSANAKTANACKKSIGSGLKIAFSAGSVMGFCVVGLGLLGISIFYLIFKDPAIIYGFGFGASSIALFARVGGGIYTKAADVGADLVGKVEAGIPEDDPRNPAVIADNVGDNVGDIAGMGADLFESYVNSIIAAMVLGVLINVKAVALPLLIAASGIIASIFGVVIFSSIKLKEGESPGSAMNKGVLAAGIAFIVFSFLITYFLLGLKVYFALLAGLISGLLIGLITQLYTSYDYSPTRKIAKASTTGTGTNIITGMAVAMQSTVWPILIISAAIIIAFLVAGLYGIALAGVGMLAILAIILATDCYGPIADNAAGIAEMAKLGKNVRERAEQLDAVGNTTAAIGKGFAIGSAALTALALFASFNAITGLNAINVSKSMVVVGLLIGALMPFLFSSFTMQAVGKAAFKVVEEVRAQWKDKEIVRGRKKPDYNRVIGITTKAALKYMIGPSLLAILVPILVGLILGLESLGGLLVGSIASGFILAIFMANAGGAWDNAKKYIEAGNFGGKGSQAHKAAVVGDTVGDPLKDTSGPSLNILIKLMSIIAILFATVVAA